MIKALLIKGVNEQLKYLDNDIVLIKESFEEIGIKINSISGSKHDVLLKLSEIIDSLGSTDTLIVYYTGHGFFKQNRMCLKLDSNNKPSSILSVNEIMDNTAMSVAKNVIFILDCCYATAIEIPWKTYVSSNTSLFLPSSKLEVAEEIEDFESSFFTYCIYNALKSKSNELYLDGKITLNNLYNVTKSKAIEYNKAKGTTKPIPELLGSRNQEIIIGEQINNSKEEKLENIVVEYLNNYIHCIEKCDKTCSEEQKWCTTIFKSDANIYKYVIPSVREFISHPAKEKKEKLNIFLESWFNKQDKYLGLLGEMGVGKTTACIYMFYYLAKQYQKNNLKYIPVYFSLSNLNEVLTKNSSLYSTIKKFMSPKFTIQDIKKLCSNKRLVFILDGFDEISGDSSISTILHNYEKLKPFMRLDCKIILTCRTHYFSEQEQLEEVLTGKSEGTDFASMLLNDEYSFNIVELQEFTEEEILQLIKLLSPERDSKKIWQEIGNIYDLKDLSKRAILLKMIVKTLPDLQKSSTRVDSATIYLKYTQRLLRREIESRKIGMEISEKENFIGYIAYLMFDNNESVIETHKFDKEINKYFASSCYTKDQLNNYNYDCKVSTFFSRDKNDNYRFMHKSFFEYYFALYCILQMGEDNFEPWKRKWFSREIACFIKELLSNKKFIHLVPKLIQISLDAKDEILIWNSLHIISLIDTEIVEKHLTEKYKNEYLQRGKTENKSVVIRQYCRVIAKFIDKNEAKILINKIIEIVKTNKAENEANNQTYFNYYGGKKAACQAFINHLSVIEPKYDVKLHLYLLETLAPKEYAEKILNVTGNWCSSQDYSIEIMNTVERIQNRDIVQV